MSVCLCRSSEECSDVCVFDLLKSVQMFVCLIF